MFLPDIMSLKVHYLYSQETELPATHFQGVVIMINFHKPSSFLGFIGISLVLTKFEDNSSNLTLTCGKTFSFMKIEVDKDNSSVSMRFFFLRMCSKSPSSREVHVETSQALFAPI